MASETKRIAPRSTPVGKKPSISTAKKYVKIIPFDPKEIIAVAANCKNWMSLAAEGPQNEKMAVHKVRYIDIQSAGWDFEAKKEKSHRVLSLAATPFRTKSRCKPGKSDDPSKPSSAMIFCTHIKHPDALADEKKLGEYLEKDACDEVDTKFPNIPDTEFDTKVTQQRNLLRKEHELETAIILINNEWSRLLKDKATQKTLNWAKKKTDKIQGNVQTHRAWNAENDKDIDQPDENSDGIILDMPIARFRLQVAKATGEIWCKIHDVTERKATDKRPKLAVVKNDAGKDEAVSYYTMEEWLRPTSVVSGQVVYSMCICASGIFLHAKFKELNVRRAAAGQASASTSVLVMDEMGDYGGDYDAGGDNETTAPAKSTASKSELDDIADGLAEED